MGIKLVTFAAQTVTPQDDALIYETALQESGMIYGGSVSIKNANVLHVEAGHGALCGRKFTIEATDVPVPLTPSGSLQGRIYIHMDLSDTGEPISFQIETASTLTPVVQQSDVNINSGIYEINLATFIVNTSTISDLVNVAPFIDVTPDSEFNSQSSNSVQNKVITKAVGDPETIGGRASKPYSIGELILASDGQLYKATSNIAQNATIVSGGNADPTGNIVSQISNLANYSIGSVADVGWGLIQPHLVLKKCGKVVDFNLIIYRPNGQDMIPNLYSFGTLTDGFQPVSTHYVLGSLYKTGDPNTRKLCVVEIRTDRSLHIGYGITTEGYDGLVFACSYLLN